MKTVYRFENEQTANNLKAMWYIYELESEYWGQLLSIVEKHNWYSDYMNEEESNIYLFAYNIDKRIAEYIDISFYSNWTSNYRIQVEKWQAFWFERSVSRRYTKEEDVKKYIVSLSKKLKDNIDKYESEELEAKKERDFLERVNIRWWNFEVWNMRVELRNNSWIISISYSFSYTRESKDYIEKDLQRYEQVIIELDEMNGKTMEEFPDNWKIILDNCLLPQ